MRRLPSRRVDNQVSERPFDSGTPSRSGDRGQTLRAVQAALPGAGAVVRWAATPAMQRADNAGRPTQNEPGTATVLIVDDDADVREIAAAMITDLGYRVLTAADGLEALDRLRQGGGRVDLLFTDIIMPRGLNGLALAAAARARYKELKILLTSGYMASIANEAAASGFAIIRKPYRCADLARVLRAALGPTTGTPASH
jgi:CheY-like chemotaxis protein